GEAGEQRLKQLVNYDYWNVRQDPKLKTKGYVLFMDNEDSYQVTFGWSQSELKENDRIFQCGTATCKFVADSGEFSEQPAIIPTNLVTSQALSSPQVHNIDSSKNSLNNISSSQKSYRFILPRVPFHNLINRSPRPYI
ncbi:19440_t:CDS:2, partial [Gigaspora rosea]